MLHGFEDETHELNDYEKDKLLPLFIKGLKTKIGKDKAITNDGMIKKLKEKYGDIDVSQARVRKIINYIRNNCLIAGLMATNRGYYITTDIAELHKYMESLRQRAEEIKRVRDSFRAYYVILERGNPEEIKKAIEG